MSRQLLAAAIRWIADNDAPGDDPGHDVLAGYISVLLVADVFGADPSDIADAVQTLRRPGSEGEDSRYISRRAAEYVKDINNG